MQQAPLPRRRLHRRVQQQLPRAVPPARWRRCWPLPGPLASAVVSTCVLLLDVLHIASMLGLQPATAQAG